MFILCNNKIRYSQKNCLNSQLTLNPHLLKWITVMYMLNNFCIGVHVYHILTLAFQGSAPDDSIRTGPGYTVHLGQPDREPYTALERVQREEESGVRD